MLLSCQPPKNDITSVKKTAFKPISKDVCDVNIFLETLSDKDRYPKVLISVTTVTSTPIGLNPFSPCTAQRHTYRFPITVLTVHRTLTVSRGPYFKREPNEEILCYLFQYKKRITSVSILSLQTKIESKRL